MANEFRHADVGADLSQAEWTAVNGHIANNQVRGDSIGFDGTTWVRVAEQVDVKLFGAVGDGIHDDTAAIQAALDVNPTGNLARGLIVYFPTGTYLVTATLNLTNRRNVHIRGAEAIGATIHAHVDGKPIIDTVGSSWLTFENLTLDGDATLTPNLAFLHARSSTADGINSSVHTYRNVRVTGNFSLGGWYNYSGENHLWDRCYVEGTVIGEFAISCTDVNYKGLASDYATIRTLASCTRLTFRSCILQEFTTAGFVPLRLRGVGSVVVEDCYLATHADADCGIALVGSVLGARISDVLQEATIDYIIHSSPTVAAAAETQQDIVVRNVNCPNYTAAAIKADEAITYRAWDVWGQMGGNPNSVLTLWIVDQCRFGKWWTAETASSGVTAQNITKSEFWREPTSHTWTVNGTESNNTYHDTTTETLNRTLVAVGAVAEAALGVDNVRAGVLSGTPRILFEDAGQVILEIDNNGGSLRFLSAATGLLGYVDSSGNVSASTAFRIGNTKVVGAQGAAIADATTDTTSLRDTVNTILDRLQAHGLIAT